MLSPPLNERNDDGRHVTSGLKSRYVRAEAVVPPEQVDMPADTRRRSSL